MSSCRVSLISQQLFTEAIVYYIIQVQAILYIKVQANRRILKSELLAQSQQQPTVLAIETRCHEIGSSSLDCSHQPRGPPQRLGVSLISLIQPISSTTPRKRTPTTILLASLAEIETVGAGGGQGPCWLFTIPPSPLQLFTILPSPFPLFVFFYYKKRKPIQL